MHHVVRLRHFHADQTLHLAPAMSDRDHDRWPTPANGRGDTTHYDQNPDLASIQRVDADSNDELCNARVGRAQG